MSASSSSISMRSLLLFLIVGYAAAATVSVSERLVDGEKHVIELSERLKQLEADIQGHVKSNAQLLNEANQIRSLLEGMKDIDVALVQIQRVEALKILDRLVRDIMQGNTGEYSSIREKLSNRFQQLGETLKKLGTDILARQEEGKGKIFGKVLQRIGDALVRLANKLQDPAIVNDNVDSITQVATDDIKAEVADAASDIVAEAVLLVDFDEDEAAVDYSLKEKTGKALKETGEGLQKIGEMLGGYSEETGVQYGLRKKLKKLKKVGKQIVNAGKEIAKEIASKKAKEILQEKIAEALRNRSQYTVIQGEEIVVEAIGKTVLKSGRSIERIGEDLLKNV